MQSMKGDCSICAAPPEVVRAINAALSKKEKLRDLAARSGFSKSALVRHSNKCIVRDSIAYCSGASQQFTRYPSA
jgi:hypothetical protein